MRHSFLPRVGEGMQHKWSMMLHQVFDDTGRSIPRGQDRSVYLLGFEQSLVVGAALVVCAVLDDCGQPPVQQQLRDLQNQRQSLSHGG